MKNILALFTLAILICTHELMLAEEGAARQYTIEIVMFAQDAADSGEYWPEDPGQPDPGKAVDILTGAGRPMMNGGRGTQDVLQGSTTQLNPVNLLPAETRKLSPTAYSLQKKGRPIMLHISWRQPVGKWKSPDWHWIQTDRLQGLLRVTRGRFLHLDVDLLLLDATTGQQYRIVAQRKMRSGELHHLDHPKLGIIARIDS